MSTRKTIEKEIVKFALDDIGMFVKFLQFVEPSDFQSDLYGTIFKVQKKHYEKYSKLGDKEYLLNFVKGMFEKKEKPLNDINDFYTSEPSFNSKEDILDNALKIIHKHRLLNALEESADLLTDPDFESIDVQNKISEALSVSYDTDLGMSIFDFDTRIDKLTKVTQSAIPSFSKNLNKYISGGRFPGELYVYMGPPGIGKSLFLVQDAYHAMLHNKKVVYVTLELSELRLGLRFDSLHAKMTSSEIYDNPQVIKDKYTLLKKTTRGDIRIKEYPPKTASVLDINIYLDQLRLYENYVPDVLIVDYGDIMKPMKSRDKEYMEQGEIFTSLRALGVERQIPIITATQGTRDMVNKDESKVDMRQTSDSFMIPRIADAMYAICQNQKQRKEGILRLKIIKNRHGVVNWLFAYNVDYARMKIVESELTPEQSD